ncbi:thioredoxin domain-containing protein [Rudaea sp.]|uniref:thioredoxin domain-containing protein n=1 Tax=Rudaea sp. TaxID=2136325 RepID=UPI00321FA82C
MSNRLANETSPYLRQHADNPVDWWPWNAEALAAARAQDKPILLSIGYSACHWCHVMAHESFEDEATARLMNEKFICIKVDREERPDLDRIYQLAHQALTRRGGGWPLTVFLAPDDLAPFYAGTYFPKEARHGMPPFAYVLEQVRGFWDTRRDAVRAQNATLREFLEHYDAGEAHDGALDDAPIRATLAQIERNFDSEYGGHAGAPKFPHCPEMELLLDLSSLLPPGEGARRADEGEDSQKSTLPQSAAPFPHPALRATFSRGEKEKQMVELTLTRMAEGGIHDQVGGGFCRYSVDERWEIPHFEKMLYDNAQLLPLYADGAMIGGNGLRAEVVQRLGEWLKREMVAGPGTIKHGAFYSALDADSEGEEGRFYVWQRDEVRALLDADEFAVAERRYGFDRPPNFEQHAWNPIVAQPLEAIAAALNLPVQQADALLSRARRKLFAARAERTPPGLDDKILTAWNALMISGLVRAARTMDNPAFTALAESALEALRANAWRDGRLYASFDDRGARLPAYLDDHAFLLDALLDLLQVDWNNRRLDWAIALAEILLERFEDHERGGFFFTAHDHEKLLQRPKPFADEALPSGNGVAAQALLRLGHLVGETRYLDAAERTLRAAYATMTQMPSACATLQRALGDFLHPRTLVVVRFDSVEEDAAWRAALHDAGSLRRIDAYFIPDQAGDLPGTLAAQKYASGGIAYVCRGTQCDPPIHASRLLAEKLIGETTRASQ